MADGASLADGFVERPAPAPRRNCVLDPVQVVVFIIAAPLTLLGLAVAHHLPTFIRIYGHVELFARRRWTFLLRRLCPLPSPSATAGELEKGSGAVRAIERVAPSPGRLLKNHGTDRTT